MLECHKNIKEKQMEDTKELANVIEYVTGYGFVDIDEVHHDYVKFTYGDGKEATISRINLKEGMCRIQSEILNVLTMKVFQ